LEINLVYNAEGKQEQLQLAVTMRTPGDDINLVRGFLLTEGIIHKASDVSKISYNTSNKERIIQEQSITAYLHQHVQIDPQKLQRHFYASSSCGVCGKSSVELVVQQSMYHILPESPKWHKDKLLNISQEAAKILPLYQQSGGNHGVILFDQDSIIHSSAEDVGRHNAMDKILGKMLHQNLLPLQSFGVLLSGRVSFELVQKAWMAGIPFIAAVGAPSSLALQLAEETGITIVGFLKDDSFNVYTHPERIQ